MMPTPTAGDDMSTLTVLTSNHSADDIVTAIREYLDYDNDLLRQLGEKLSNHGIQRVGNLRGLSDEDFSELLTTVCGTHLGVKSALRHVRGVHLLRCSTLAQIWASCANYTSNRSRADTIVFAIAPCALFLDPELSRHLSSPPASCRCRVSVLRCAHCSMSCVCVLSSFDLHDTLSTHIP